MNNIKYTYNTCTDMTAFSGFFFILEKLPLCDPLFAINYSIFGKNTFIKRPGKNTPSKVPTDGGLPQLHFFPELVLNFFQINTLSLKVFDYLLYLLVEIFLKLGSLNWGHHST